MHAKINNYKQRNLLYYFAGKIIIILIYKQGNNLNLIYEQRNRLQYHNKLITEKIPLLFSLYEDQIFLISINQKHEYTFLMKFNKNSRNRNMNLKKQF